jgi:tetratricopeptide (TPR) repeat protein
MRRWILFALMLSAVASCRKAPVPKTPDEVMTDVNKLMAAGDTEGALKTLDAAVSVATNDADRGQLFQQALTVRLQAGRVDEARQIYLGVVGKDPVEESAGYGVVATHYAGRGMTNELVEWTGVLVDAPLSAPYKPRAYLDHLQVLQTASNFTRIADVASRSVTNLPPQEARSVLDQAFRQLFSVKAFDDAGRLVKQAREAAGESADMQEFLTLAECDLCFRSGQWAEAEKQFVAMLPTLSDTGTRRGLTTATAAAWGGEQWDLADRLCRSVMDLGTNRPAASAYAHTAWVEGAERRGDAAETVERMRSLLERKVEMKSISQVYSRHFYFVVNDGRAELTKALLDIGEQLLAKLDDPNESSYLRGLVFDAAFVAEDYDRALSLLEKGMPGRDEAWMAMARNKIHAHKALKEGRVADAVERFRQFMKDMDASWKGPEQDPSSGLTYTKEMTLGFNAARIGRILQGAGNAKEADAAYGEARGYYEKALAGMDEKSREYQHVKKEMAALPAPSGNP